MRKLAAFAIAFSAGVFLAQYVLPLIWQLPLGLACTALMALGFRKTGHARLRLFLIFGGLALAFLYNRAYVAAVQSPAESLAEAPGTRRVMTLMDYPAPARYGCSVTVRLEGVSGVRAVYYGDGGLALMEPGDRITGDVTLKSAAKIHEDDVTAFTSRGVFLLAYSQGEVTAEKGTSRPLRWWPLRLGKAMRDRLDLLYGGVTASFLSALLTGDKSGLSVEDYAALSEAGLYHVLAVSGMHCGVLVMLAVGVFGRQRKRLLAAVAIPLLAFYALLTGCSPSVVRACIMCGFLLAAPLFRRESDPPTALAAALFLILLQNPFAAASVSLQLSFAAVAGLLWLTPKLMRAFTDGKKRGRAALVVMSSLSATAGVLVFTVPLSAFYFNLFVLVSPLSNLLCLAAVSVMFLTGLLSLTAGAVFPPLGGLLALAVEGLCRYVLWVARTLSRVPYHAVYFSNPYLKYWLAAAYGLFAIALLMKGPRRRYAVAAVFSAAMLAASVAAGQYRYTAGTLDITVLDVGQGACTAVSSGGAFAIIDCGSGNSWYDAGEIASDALQSRGCFRLDYLLLTHYDTDHVSGVEYVLARLRVGALVVPDIEDDGGLGQRTVEAAQRHGVPVILVTEETPLKLGNATVTVYPPDGGARDGQSGLACLVTAGDYDLLVTGDMGSAAEKRLIGTYTLPDVEALVVGHHGSKSSTSVELLEAVRPETAVISVGANSYGHPAGQTLRRLLAAGAEVYRTDQQGDIHITVN